MMYHPQRYPEHIVKQLDSIQVIHYVSGGQSQQAFFISGSQKPKYVWILLGGNAAVALQWLPLIQQANMLDTGYLLVDYPGYGLNDGYPSQHNNRQAVLDAYSALKKQNSFLPEVFLLGLSIGSAVAIDAASSIQPQSLVLISPFTSTYAMSKRVIGSLWAWILRPFLWDSYQSETSLKRLIASYPDMKILILHGQNDEIVPVSMGKQLANLSPTIVYRPLAGVGHDLPYAAQKDFLAALTLNH